MEQNLFKYMAFVQTVESGSFTKAAERLHYSQSGISRMIHDLESEWHMTLLERSRTGVTRTSDGAFLLPYVRQLCDAYDKLQMAVADMQGLQYGLIRVGTFSSVATHWLPRMVQAFQTDYPGIDCEFVLGDYAEIEDWIAEGRVDCGFVRLPTNPAWETQFLQRDALLAILPEQHPLAAQEVVSLQDLCNQPFLLLEKSGQSDIRALCEQYALTPHVRLTTWDDYAILSMVESGLGVSILPELILKRIPYQVAIRALDVPAYREIGFTLRNKKTASLAAKRFLDYLPYRNR